MKRFEAIEEKIKFLETTSYLGYDADFLSELKQITDEHSEMVEMLNIVKETTQSESTFIAVSQLLTKINGK